MLCFEASESANQQGINKRDQWPGGLLPPAGTGPSKWEPPQKKQLNGISPANRNYQSCQACLHWPLCMHILIGNHTPALNLKLADDEMWTDNTFQAFRFICVWLNDYAKGSQVVRQQVSSCLVSPDCPYFKINNEWSASLIVTIILPIST